MYRKDVTDLKHTCSKCDKVRYSKVKPGHFGLPKGWTVKRVGRFLKACCKECSNG